MVKHKVIFMLDTKMVDKVQTKILKHYITDNLVLIYRFQTIKNPSNYGFRQFYCYLFKIYVLNKVKRLWYNEIFQQL
jgi:hypothetical protein